MRLERSYSTTVARCVKFVFRDFLRLADELSKRKAEKMRYEPLSNRLIRDEIEDALDF